MIVASHREQARSPLLLTHGLHVSWQTACPQFSTTGLYSSWAQLLHSKLSAVHLSVLVASSET
jgi:hypothetical protein